jgi:hypothetical protein
MVNNEDAVSNNLRKAKQQYPGLLNDKNGIIGVVSLNYWFQTLLYDLLQKETITLFLKSMSSSSQKIRNLQLRFHQKYIVKCSQLFIENGTDKFIWGAVPRSGKSYMIGGLISERFEKGITNNIVIILGALTETLQQFKDMFKDFSNFDKYTIIT